MHIKKKLWIEQMCNNSTISEPQMCGFMGSKKLEIFIGKDNNILKSLQVALQPHTDNKAVSKIPPIHYSL